MEFIFEGLAGVDAFATFARVGRVATLEDKIGYKTVKERAGVVAIETVLEEGAGCEGGLFGEEFEKDVAGGGGEKNFGGGLRLKIVD